ncbi:MAG: hypothetical protein EBR32_02355 [Bacteroidetes bacterium]|nr:hypothetical protein [Bacteroidota bacterium]
MNYPIFQSIVNTIRSDVESKHIRIENFRTWQDNTIFATGLELSIQLKPLTKFFDKLSINFDWDQYREYQIAKNLEGLDNHPLLETNELAKSIPKPTIDVELMWVFNSEKAQPVMPNGDGNYRMDFASSWMEQITQNQQLKLQQGPNITRWHVEIEGDKEGKFLSTIQLISYFQFNLSDLVNMQELQEYVQKSLKELLVRSSRVIQTSEDTISKAIAERQMTS